MRNRMIMKIIRKIEYIKGYKINMIKKINM